MKKTIASIFILLIYSSLTVGQIRIKMEKENGVYLTPCTVNGLRLKFIFDTGASNVALSITEAAFMLRNGYLMESDIKGASYSQIANGEIIQNTSVLLKELVIGGLKLQNIEAVIIHDLSAPLLLGQSAIEKLGKIQLENDELVILSGASVLTDCSKAWELIENAKQYYFKELYTLSIESFQKATDICPESLNSFSLIIFGNAQYYCNNFRDAIKCLEKVRLNENDTIVSSFIHSINSKIGISYFDLGDYQNAKLNLEKSILSTNDYDELSSDYFYLGLSALRMSNNQECVKLLEKSIELYLKSKDIKLDNIVKGYIKDPVLGERYFNVSLAYANLNLSIKSDNYVMLGALCGHDYSIEFCNKYFLDYLKLRDAARQYR